MTLKIIFTLALLLTTSVTTVFSQEYLDSDKRYMRITEVSTDKTYGYELKNPIRLGSDQKEIAAYLNSLKPLNGDRLHIRDMKFGYQKKSGLTMVVLQFEQKEETETIYFLSDEFKQPKAIIGCSFKTVEDIPKVTTFPADSIVKVSTCSQTIYSVDDYFLKEKFGDLTKPTTNPTFTGGIDELKKYFIANTLKDEEATQLIFRVSIAFIVTCEGTAGNFVIASKGKGKLETYANQVLAIVNSMPQNWQPATVDGNPVDCYQVLSFTAATGKLGEVLYR